jgi:predicted NUDIX family NTP pyrophosphohydrolase
MFRRGPDGELQVFLVHPGGPFFKKKDEGAWSIPKGLMEAGELPLEAAVREFEEETGVRPQEPLYELGSVVQRGGKIVHAWGFQRNGQEGVEVRSNTFEMEWPPRSGRRQAFPEIDRGEFFDLPEARRKINPAQTAFLDRLAKILDGPG